MPRALRGPGGAARAANPTRLTVPPSRQPRRAKPTEHHGSGSGPPVALK
jgi:hypothetical protein